MDFNHEFLEHANLIAGFVPVDMSTGTNAGSWVKLSEYQKMVAVLFKAAGANGEPPVISMLQATDASGTGSKALNTSRVRTKQSTATLAGTTGNGVGIDTIVTQAAASTYTAATGDKQGIFAIEVNGHDLDVANSFTFVSMSVADVGATAQLGCALYILLNPRHPQSVPISPFSN